MKKRNLTAAALTLLGVSAFAQVDGPPDPRTPTPIRVSANVTEVSGVGATAELRLALWFPKASKRYFAITTPGSAGVYTFDFYVDREVVTAYDASLEVRLAADTSSPAQENQFFLDPQAGRAGFVASQKIVFNQAAGRYEATASTVLSLPPLYGNVTVTGGAPGGATIAVVNRFTPEPTFSKAFSRETEYRLSLPAGNSPVPIYRWSLSGASDVSLRGPLGVSIAQGMLRRGGGLVLAPKEELAIDLQVSEMQWPSAHKVLLVAPEHHLPNPAVPSGSDSSYWEQDNRKRASQTVEFVSGTSASRIVCVAGSYVAELWSMTEDSTGAILYHLDAAQVVSAGTTSVLLVF